MAPNSCRKNILDDFFLSSRCTQSSFKYRKVSVLNFAYLTLGNDKQLTTISKEQKDYFQDYLVILRYKTSFNV